MRERVDRRAKECAAGWPSPSMPTPLPSERVRQWMKMGAGRCMRSIVGGRIKGEEMERVKGIEPSYEAWEAAVLPLNYTRGPARILQRAWDHQRTEGRAAPRAFK